MHTMSFNILIQMEFDFCKINSFWSSINKLIITSGAQQCRTQIKRLYHNVLDLQIRTPWLQKGALELWNVPNN